MTRTCDVAIIGGGAAGIGAGLRLTELGRTVRIIEALPRLGGRAHTEIHNGLPLDMGCGWLHSARRNPLAALAAARGETIDHSEGAWYRQLDNIDFPAADQRAARQAFDDLHAKLHAAPPLNDVAAEAMPATDRWRAYADAISSYINGVELDQLSAADFLAYEDASTDDNWRLPDGYGTFISGLGASLPASLSTHANAISEHGGIVVDTDTGPIHARAVIITVSTTVLASGRIRLPASADDHLHAASKLPLGLADKVFFALGVPDIVPAESHLLGSATRAETASYYFRPFGRPVVECFIGGAFARSLERDGEDAAFAVTREELTRLMGADFVKQLTPIVATRWAHEPTVGGSYSHALPTHAGARAVLARPVSERMIFAGEACSAQDFSTAHGAWQSGRDAADHIEQHLKGS